MFRLTLVFICLFSTGFSKMYHNWIENNKISSTSYCWSVKNAEQFDELLISWNASRPQKGYFDIYISVNSGKWSPWMIYAKWGSNFQKSFKTKKENYNVSIFQDTLEILENAKGTGFKIKIVAKKGANLKNLKSLHVCASEIKSLKNKPISKVFNSSLLDLEGLSQMALLDSRKERLCSPTSTTAVLRYLNNENFLDPIQFAESSWDSGFDIFGNWVFNVAEANNKLKNEKYSCWVERFDNFDEILESLEKGFPTIISIRGPLPRSALPYKSGHLLVVIGYDRSSNEVYCMDPAFKTNNETLTKYKLDDLVQAWSRRKNVAYVFREKDQ